MDHLQFTPRRAARLHTGVTIFLAAIMVAGCQTYEPRPLDVRASADAFLARTLDGGEVASFAEHLRTLPTEAAKPFECADGLSLAEAECLAMVFNQELRVARLRAGVTQATAENAGLWQDPVFGMDLTRLLGSAGHAWEALGTLSLTLPLSGRLEIEVERADVAHRAQLARVAAQEWETRMELRREWTRRGALTSAVDATAEFLARLDEIIRIVDLLESAGELSRTQARLFRVERAAQHAEHLDRLAQRSQSDGVIRSLLGLSPRVVLALDSCDLRASIAAESSSLDSDATHTQLLDSNLELRALQLDYDLSERDLAHAIAAQYPDLTIGPGYGSQDGDAQFVFGFSAPLALFNGNRSAIAAARAQREVAGAVVEETLQRLLAEVAQGQQVMAATRTTREAIEAELVPLVDAQYADARAVAEQGEVDALLLLTSLARQQEARLLLINALRDETLAHLRLVELPGPPSPVSTSSSALEPTP